MKKIFALLCIFFVCSAFVFADEQGDEYDDDYTYELYGAGDQFLKIGLIPFIPLNFGGKVHVGGAAEIGYYRFLNNWLAIGGDVSFSFNMTIGSNTLTLIPIVFGVTMQPSIKKIDIPIQLGIGIAYESAQNANYFPGFVMKAEVGAYYRVIESWSFGLFCGFYWFPQWTKTTNDNGLFLAPAITARYHF